MTNPELLLLRGFFYENLGESQQLAYGLAFKIFKNGFCFLSVSCHRQQTGGPRFSYDLDFASFF
jgi:hypothetical protein